VRVVAGTVFALASVPGMPPRITQKGSEMENMTYRRTLSDPTVREAIEKEVCRLRTEAFERYLVEPVKALLRRMRRPAFRQRPVLELTHGSTIDTTVHQGGTLRIDDAAGFQIKVTSGRLWITQQDDIRDYVIDPYQAFTVKRNGATLAHALKGASLHIAAGWPGGGVS
jgi:hypothetical protein